MTTRTSDSVAAPARAAVVEIRLPEGGAAQDVRAVKVVWQREMIRFTSGRKPMSSIRSASSSTRNFTPSSRHVPRSK